MNHVKDGYANMGLICYNSKQYQDTLLEWLPITKGKAVLIVNKKSVLGVMNAVSVRAGDSRENHWKKQTAVKNSRGIYSQAI